MKKAYIILAHKNPEQLKRLIKKLDDNLSNFFLHIDKTADIEIFKNQFRNNKKIYWVERVVSGWASFELIISIINSLHEIKKTKKQFDRIILLSGQDYPIKSNGFINDFLSKSPFPVFMEYYALPNEKWQPQGGLYRVNKYYFGSDFFEKYSAKTINFLSSFLFPLKRKLDTNLTPYAGSQWWIIDEHSMNYMLNYIKLNPSYIKFHRYTFAPDEVFFQTILLNAKDEKLLQNISRDNKRFYKWKDASNAHPDVLKQDDLEDIIQSGALFARKFDTAVDEDILDSIDKYCLQDNVVYE